MPQDTTFQPSTLAAQALGYIDPATNAVVPAIHPSTTYLRDPDNQYRNGLCYSRDNNPSYDQAEALLNALEGGQGCLLFASGMAAATAVFQALKPGDHVVAETVMYWGLRKWLTEVAAEWGLAVDFVPTGNTAALSAALKPGRTKLVWVETPANPTWEVTDIAAWAELAHGAGARLAVDSTVATPVLTRPIAHGADLVMHAATKYLNGHSDVIGGALVTARQDAFWERLCRIRHDGGAVLGPFEAWLLLRGMRTLYLRVERCCRNAQALAEHFQGHGRIAAVHYPGLGNDPGHAIAKRQMTGGFGGMLSVRVRGGEAAAIAAAARVRLFKRATSLGGVESLIEHRASIEGLESPVPRDLLRLSIGIEDAGDLIADLDQALG
ncbi:MAG TPA: aminotransferase class I/II-fold pyridoxal phosphate-dependent enzyme [Alphaproteobacteria bacterium]|nr:aminotransferase class I/II-fold pyridoxal phosphate-dependent enzyme [Alphaproteobacteria bacterium]